MASRHDYSALQTWFAATALSALCWWFGGGIHPQWWLTWLAPLPVLWLAPRVRARSAALSAFAAYAAGSLSAWTYLHTYIGLPWFYDVYAISVSGVMLMLCMLLYRRLLLRGHTLAAALAVPTMWVAFEYVTNLLSPHGTITNISYTQMDALAVIQMAAITGIWGIGFLLLLVPTTIALQATPRASKRSRITVAVLTAILVVGTLAYGGWRLQAPATETLRIGLVSLQKPTQAALSEPKGQALEARYMEAFGRFANDGAHIVLAPEGTFAAADMSIPAFSQMSKQRDLIVGSGVVFYGDPRGHRNMLMVFQPGATSPATYNKHHMLPGMDPFLPGDDYTMLQGEPRIGLAICKDMDFHDIGDAYAARRAQLLLVPASDFTVDGWLHSRIAVMRGVESGFAVARAAHAGRLTLSDDRGRVVAEASSEGRDAELVGDLPLRETHTFYARWGDWFAWLDLTALAAWLVLAFVPRKAPVESPGQTLPPRA
ncbi:nitrilase-related carbon-nitrogen hydrolase [Dyella nitratireducens]|uniref:Apolipoprotein N-acyltransferase n=1 Tax=Dyella nitratireducens TaxID=1849580 RepID=A0ABQ1FJW3_9GAMM|nr:nitrilase-related carbon-nitrogen hydrolase [Dyella nitratireducens]GGA19320.1 apolipoprotein N-acyltransferase [Dyella nitratireducens]GLQ44525.1 apolipoprotein N-acyltransferase [Dyella nitratireducens]